jgi:isopropylmalate/homocitrate/citramalate synthase
MTTQRTVNNARHYHNYQGRFPPLNLEDARASLPVETAVTHPKRLTDTTLRDGAQDPRFALFPFEAKLRYVDLLHRLDNGTGRIEQIEVFIYQQRDRRLLSQLLERGYRYPEITTWTRATPKDIKDLVSIADGAIHETGMLASSITTLRQLGHQARGCGEIRQPIMTAVGTASAHESTRRTYACTEGWCSIMTRVLDETNGRRVSHCDTIGRRTRPECALTFRNPSAR